MCLQGALVIQPDQMQVSDINLNAVIMTWADVLTAFEDILTLFPKDCQPNPDPDSGAYYGQLSLPSDQEMWPELHVSIAGKC